MENPSKSRLILKGAVSVALALLLANFKVYQLPMGGEVSLKTLPLLVFAFSGGLKAGALAGFIFGLAHFIQIPILVNPFQFLLDYPLAGMSLGLAGLFSGGKGKLLPLLGVLLAQALRFFCHFLSGLIFIKSFLPEIPASLNFLGKKLPFTPALYSFLYNLSYVLPETLLCLLLILPIIKALRRA